MLMKLGALINQGASVDMVLEKVEELKTKICCHVLTPGVVNVSRVNNVRHRNGIFNGLFNFLSVHSVTRISHNSNRIEVLMFGKLESCYKKLIRKLIKEHRKIDFETVYVSHAAIPLKNQKEILEEIDRSGRFDNVLLECCSVSNACYSGLGTLAVAYLKY